MVAMELEQRHGHHRADKDEVVRAHFGRLTQGRDFCLDGAGVVFFMVRTN
jgi:hypothetical protein